MTDTSRTQSIAHTIRAALSGIMSADADKGTANEALQEAAAAAQSARETVLVSLAAAADADNWTPGEISAAATLASKMGNVQLPKSVATFMSEARKAMAPGVRAHVPALVALGTEAWEAEGLAGKDAPRPLRKAFKRRYHMILRLFGRASEGVVMETTAEVVAWAAANDPDLDYAKVHARLQAIRKELAAFATDFPVDGFVSVDAYLGDITEAALREARTARAVVADTIVSEPAPVAPVGQTVEASADPLRDLLDDAVADLLMAA